MFGWLKKKRRQSPTNSIRETLFGDMPLSAWSHGEGNVTPWAEFTQVQRHLETQDVAAATAQLRQIASLPNLESRHYLQAWNELRRLGVKPTAEAKQLLGVVVEVGLDEGLDLLAAYADGSARYFNFSGAAVVWERPDTSLDDHVDALFSAATVIRSDAPHASAH
jgi:hypothetical protein